MPKTRNIVAGSIFLLIACLTIAFSGFSPMWLPTQEDHAPRQYGFGPNPKYLMKQPVIMKEDYLYGVDVLFSRPNNPAPVDNVILLTDSNYNVLTTMKFSSQVLPGPIFMPFKFNKKIMIGKGHKCYLIVYTPEGDMTTTAVMGMLTSTKFSPLYFVRYKNNDVLNSLKDPGEKFEKSICFRTYESEYNGFSIWQMPFYLLTVIITLIIIFFGRSRSWLLKVKISPDRIYLSLGVGSGILLVFVTPPLQIPDENYHLYRSYQLSEFNIFQYDQSIPTSLIRLSDTMKRMNFEIYEKTSREELKGISKMRLKPTERTAMTVPGYFLPYAPQAIGMFFGRLFDCSPLSLLYIGRIFNLICSVLIVFLAIRAAPFFKWIFFLLALMPMTQYLFSSLSKDGMTISLSFLLIAILLRFAFDKEKKISTADLVILLILACCVALTRYIYLIILVMYFFIPVFKLGTVKRYFLVFFIILFSALAVIQIPKLAGFLKPSGKNSVMAVTQPSDPAKKADQGNVHDQTQALEGANQKEQINFILKNPGEYLGIVYKTVFIYLRAKNLNSFVGILGWMTRPVPIWLINLYLWILVLTALAFPGADNRTGIKNRLLLLFIFIAGILLIETGQYVAWSAVGQKYIEGVQGRYFTPYAPAFFLLFYNNFISGYLKNLLSRGKTKTAKQKQKSEPKAIPEINPDAFIIFTKSFYILLVCFAVLSIICTFYTVLSNFYVVLL